jgi:hypothetical protein
MYGKVGRGLSAERVYLGGVHQETRALPSASVKLDVVAGPKTRPVHVYDYKFTVDPNPTLSTSRIAQIQRVVGLSPDVPIEVIHPSQWSAS